MSASSNLVQLNGKRNIAINFALNAKKKKQTCHHSAHETKPDPDGEDVECARLSIRPTLSHHSSILRNHLDKKERPASRKILQMELHNQRDSVVNFALSDDKEEASPYELDTECGRSTFHPPLSRISRILSYHDDSMKRTASSKLVQMESHHQRDSVVNFALSEEESQPSRTKNFQGPFSRTSSILRNNFGNSRRTNPQLLSRGQTLHSSKSWSKLTHVSSFIHSLNNFSSARKLDDVHGNQKLKILALHGKASNGEVTKLQLANLGITDEDHYDIIYLDGPIVEEDGDAEVKGLVRGPLYSWFHGNYSDARFRPSFLHAISLVIVAIEKLGPFDAVYGFSQGATVAAFAALSTTEPALQRALVMSNLRNFNEHGSFMILRFELSRRGGKSSILSKMSMTYMNEITEKMFQESFSYMILACPVDDPFAVKKALGLITMQRDRSVSIASMFLIGTDDPNKDRAEKMVYLFSDVQVRYFVGGHSINRLVSSDEELMQSLKRSLNQCQNVATMESPVMKKVSDLSSIGLMSSVQFAHVEVDSNKTESTLARALSRSDRTSPLFYNAREFGSNNCTSYGDVLDFIQKGAGDLRRLNVQDGEVVAYGSPPGGGAVSALAFLSIMAQTTAAPIAPSLQESEVIYFLEHFNAKHLILFEGVNSPGLESAFEKYAATGKAVLHRAALQGGGQPGMFKYTQSGQNKLDSDWVEDPSIKALQNPADGIGLLLATSGTTSKPKGVPILHSSLVKNGYIIASTLGLHVNDVCYSIMPLFHIGGISASIMCSIAAGASICCENEAYSPANMIDALALSNPQPTWYSAVPTIHKETIIFINDNAKKNEKLKAYGINENGIWKDGHSLRMIRSGAAALFGPDAINLSMTYGDIPIIPTYSMSEQMPIAQPPAGKTDMITDKPGSVGCPIAASLVVVNSSSLKPLPYGQEGEIAICGSTVIQNYWYNKEVDRKTFFELTLPTDFTCEAGCGRFFLTGDIGTLDKEGYLSLRGRKKELIKKGGEQISPFEIESYLLDHPWVEESVCFPISSQLYGEEAGAAIVLSSQAPPDLATDKLIKEMRNSLRRKDVAALKWPSTWKFVQEDDLLKTKTNKYIRNGLSKHLDLEDEETKYGSIVENKTANNTFIDWDVIISFRFLLACYVMFMHIGSNESFGAFSNLRHWPWHVHVFFTLGGYSLAAPMNPIIENKFKFFIARISAMYPMYLVALVLVLINLLMTCRPSTFQPDFHWDAQPGDLYIDGDKEKGLSPLFCEGTPATRNSYWGSLFLTIIVYLTGSSITPFFLMSWWMGFYFWFCAMYYQCLMIFPVMYNYLAKLRSNTRRHMTILIGLFTLDLILLLVTWFLTKDSAGYNHYDKTTGLKNDADSYNDAHENNLIILSWYLFSPFWMLYFMMGAVTAFLYDAYRPAERYNCRIWGYIADMCTLIVLIWSICLINQGIFDSDFENDYDLRPEESNRYTDSSITNRLWDNISGRLVAPLTTLWVFALSTGEGWSASMLRRPFIVDIIAPHAYNCFLFHQPVAQWYFSATRNGQFWNYWRYRKTMYWFSPNPVPVEWYEYIYLVTLTVWFSALMNATALPLVCKIFNFIGEKVFGKSFDEAIDLEGALIGAIEDMTGFVPELSWTLDQCGLASLGLPQLALKLQKVLSTKKNPLSISAAALTSARTVGDIAEILRNIQKLSNSGGI